MRVQRYPRQEDDLDLEAPRRDAGDVTAAGLGGDDAVGCSRRQVAASKSWQTRIIRAGKREELVVVVAGGEAWAG